MGVKVKSGMVCEAHGPVLAQKNGHGLRNTVAAVSAPLGGVGVLLAKREAWACPVCGGPVKAQSAVVLWKRKPRGERVVWSCSKHGHKLDRKRTVCPIDGSDVGWMPVAEREAG